jgi:tRNA (guanine37-N1)-methyltransferase
MTPWRATILTLFPDIFPGPLAHSLAGKGLQQKIWQLQTINIRDFAADKHKTVDDTCFGGGAGMVLKPDVVHSALESALKSYNGEKPSIIYLTPRGTPLTQLKLRSIVNDHACGAMFLCGRYEGVDDRVIQHWQQQHHLQEISLGDYILSGGEIAALTIIDACVRLLPGIVNKVESLESESFELDLLEFPHYTKPHNWQNQIVPEILLSGDHKKIAAWRHKQAEKITRERRPDLWQSYLNKKLLSDQK